MFVVAQFEIAPVDPRPFPHLLIDDYLEPDLSAQLASSFPECPPNSGPTGYSYFWGDPEYDHLLAENEAWRTLFQRVQNQAFIDYVLAQFREVFVDESVVDLSQARYVAYQESRADKERARLARIEHSADELWVRMDIMQGRMGYDRAPHLDHRRRAATMLIYFCDSDENQMVGGDLVLHGAAGERVVVKPRHNRMVLFPCNNASLHSVPAVTAQTKPRNFVQITISSSVDLWAPVGGSRLGRAASRLRSLIAQVRG